MSYTAEDDEGIKKYQQRPTVGMKIIASYFGASSSHFFCLELDM